MEELEETPSTLPPVVAGVLVGGASRRMGTANEIAEMVCWLCSNRASYVNGATYNVDGGYVAN